MMGLDLNDRLRAGTLPEDLMAGEAFEPPPLDPPPGGGNPGNGTGTRSRTGGEGTDERSHTDDWEQPVPICAMTGPPFPIDALPHELAMWAEEVARETQTPLDLPAMMGIAALAGAAGGKAELDLTRGWIEPHLGLYVVVALPPGERKSAVVTLARRPIEAAERAAAKRLAPERAAAEAKAKALEARLKDAIKAAAKAEGKDREACEAAAGAAAVEAQEHTVPALPRYVVGDITPEQLATVLVEQRERVALLSGEGGGPLAIMAGRYSADSAPRLEVFLSAHAGEAHRVDRRARSETLRSPCLSMGLALQPCVIRALSDKRELRGRGLLARLLYSLPASRVGGREHAPASVRTAVRLAFEYRIQTLAAWREDLTERVRLQLSEQAVAALDEYRILHEPRLGPEGDLHCIADWANKLPGALGRLAGLFHLWAHACNPDIGADLTVGAADIERAIRLANYLIAHARVAFGVMGEDGEVDDARHVLVWLRRRAKDGVREVSIRDVHCGVRGRSSLEQAEQVAQALELLEERAYVRTMPPPKRCGPGRPASPRFELSPYIGRGRA